MPYKDPEKNKQATRKWRIAHAEKNREYARQWRARNPEKNLESMRKYNAEHREERKKYISEQRTKNPKKFSEQVRKWRHANPDKHREIKLQRRAREKGIVFSDVDLESIWNKYNGTCYLCGQPIDRKDCHYDHVIPLSKGGTHTTENIRPTHSKCNLKKGSKIIKWIQSKLL